MLTVTLGELGSHLLMQTLKERGIGLDLLASALWSQGQIPLAKKPQTIELQLTPIKELGLNNCSYHVAAQRLITWNSTVCPAETVAALGLQHGVWLTGKHVVIVMDTIRFPDMMNDNYAYVLCVKDGNISVINVADDHLPLTEDTMLVVVKRI